MQKISTLIAMLCILLFVKVTYDQVTVAANNALPDMGSSTNKILPLNIEQQLGDYYMRILRQQLPIIDDPQIREYINELGFRLVASNDDAKNRQFYFFVVNDPSVNAFAMPGGYIGINTGLIQSAENVSELAGVMSHEIAHVTQRHLARRIEKQDQLSMPMLLATLGSILVMTQNSEAGMAAMTGLQAGVSQIMINYTRSNESEADRIGIATLANANFDPTGMGTFFEKMLKLSRYRGVRLAFLSTHPLSQARITESRDRARNINVVVKENNFKFSLFKERLANFLPQNKNSIKRIYENKLANSKNEQFLTTTQFGYALILTTLSEHEPAITILKKLLKENPGNKYFLLALAQIYSTSGDPKSAIKLLEVPYRLNPGNDPITMSYAKALLADQQIKRSLDILYEHLPKVEKEPSIYQLIAEAQSSDGLFKEVHESTGLYLYHSGDLHGALAQFKMAMKGRSDDPYFNSRLRARIKKVQKEIIDTR